MIVVYNNSGSWNWIDSFTVSKAMFGSFGFVLGMSGDGTIGVTGHGYLGQRKVTKETFRSLSVVGVLEENATRDPVLRCYHNPFAKVPVDPSLLAILAESQYIHRSPHERGFVTWEPEGVET